MLDEEPDDPHGECAHEIHRLKDERDELAEEVWQLRQHLVTLAALVEELTPEMYEYTGEERDALAEAEASKENDDVE